MATDDLPNDNEIEKETLYKTKAIHFLGRQTPIILQNDNGPCPLLAICNVLLLKNNLNLHPEVSEVSVQKLLSLVAEKLIDCNCCNEDKDAGYVENQQQNISDAIDLLPSLATGIDVNVQFQRIDGFEFTRECAIFDLLGIPLYHGWIVDPQDHDTAYAVGSKSYNTLMGELVALETKDTEGKLKSNIEEDCIDFAAATAATLGVPSPCLSKAKSFDDSPCSASSHKEGRRGDLEEEAELLRALQISASLDEPLSAENFRLDVSVNTDESTHLKSSEGLGIPPDAKEGHTSDEQNFCQPELLLSHNANESSTCNDNVISLDAGEKESSYSNISSRNNVNHSTDMASEECSDSCNLMEYTRNDMLVQNRNELSLSLDEGSSSEHKDRTCKQDTSTSSVHVPEDSLRGCETIDVSTGVASSLNGNEPIYEGEDRILDSGSTIFESGEPMYEGEMVLAEQADKVIEDVCDVHSKDDVSQQNGDLIRKFLSSNASQLTIYGLFCLQEGLKERELCVFFRNNHFSTLFKFNNELYLLATDQGYLCEPSLVWEKLNEVNGDTVFMTGNFTEFNLENQVKDTWDEQNARTTTADFLASIDNSEPSGSTLTSDMELAIALQQQEFENQPQRVSNTQQSSAFGRSGLVTGPQVSKTNPSNASTTSKHEGKSKEKNNCAVM